MPGDCWHLLTQSVNQVGKTLAFTSIKFTNPNGDLVARGSHTKCVQDPILWILTNFFRYISLAWKDPKNIVEELKNSPS